MSSVTLGYHIFYLLEWDGMSAKKLVVYSFYDSNHSRQYQFLSPSVCETLRGTYLE